jgi:hypothetical protein
MVAVPRYSSGAARELGTVSVDRELGELRFHWGSAYRLSYGAGTWTAARLDTGARLTAPSSGELWELIRKDYAANPVSREP